MLNIFQIQKTFHITPLVSNFLHLSRWLAAFVVVLSHVRAVSFPSFEKLGASGLIWKIFYFVTSLGHEAVMIFFVLSGYLIGGEILRGLHGGNFRWAKYLTKRIVRLYIVLIPALLLTSLWDHVGYWHFNDLGSYDRFWEDGKESLKTFFLNVLMLQHSYGPLFGSNDPLWSLAYEFWYYLMFPLAVQVFFLKNRLLKVLSLGSFAAIAIFLNPQISLYFTVWLLGVVIWHIKSERLSDVRYIGWGLTAVFVLAVTFSRYKEGFGSDLLLGLVFSVIILYFMTEPKLHKKIVEIINWRYHKFLADFSYSLYLLHFPLMLLLANIVFINLSDFREVGGFRNILFFAGLIFVLYFYSFVVYWFTERRTKEVTQELLKRLALLPSFR